MIDTMTAGAPSVEMDVCRAACAVAQASSERAVPSAERHTSTSLNHDDASHLNESARVRVFRGGRCVPIFRVCAGGQ